jgi:hypothetical protein
VLTVVALLSAASAASGRTEDPKPDEGKGADRYVLPQGNVPDLVKFIQRLAQYQPEEPTDVVEHRIKFRPALQEAGEQILRLEKDHGSEAYEAARFVVLANRVYWFARVLPEEQRRIVADVRAYLEEKLKQGKRQEAAGGMAAAAAKVIQQTGQWDWAAECYEAFGALLQQGDKTRLSELADAMRASAENLRAMSKDGPKPSQIEIAPQGTMTTIDLSKHANWGNTEWWGDSFHGNGLAELPKGDQVLRGVKFDITEKMMQLGYIQMSDAPLHIDGIPVGRKLHRLYVLHGTQHWSPEGTAVAAYKVHYEDGSEASIPVVYGQDVRDWWDHDQGMPVTRGRVVWTGSNPNSDRTGTTLRLYLGVWENPHPEKTVANLDFVKTEDRTCGPICLAITAEGP